MGLFSRLFKSATLTKEKQETQRRVDVNKKKKKKQIIDTNLSDEELAKSILKMTNED